MNFGYGLMTKFRGPSYYYQASYYYDYASYYYDYERLKGWSQNVIIKSDFS